jgi:hypothetical protein
VPIPPDFRRNEDEEDADLLLHEVLLEDDDDRADARAAIGAFMIRTVVGEVRSAWTISAVANKRSPPFHH